jgi:hypothetical protein
MGVGRGGKRVDVREVDWNRKHLHWYLEYLLFFS